MAESLHGEVPTSNDERFSLSAPHRGTSFMPATFWLMILLLALAAAPLAAREGADGGPAPSVWEIGLWVGVGAVAALHRPLGGSALGLGTLVLPAVIGRFGIVAAALVAALVRVLSTLLWRLADRRRDQNRAAGSELAAALVVALAALAGAAAGSRDADSHLVARALVAAVVYVLVFSALAATASRLRRIDGRRIWPQPSAAELSALGLDAAGWLLGSLLASAAEELGWWHVGPILGALALLATEAARNAFARGASDVRIDDFERLHRAHERILGETSGMGAIAEQILVECCNILPVEWYQFELPPSAEPSQQDGTTDSWWAGPGGRLEEGRPRPTERPRMLPGVHRRASWRILEKSLVVEGEVLATVRLWCDPRRIDCCSEAVLSTLVPQMASSVHRARLDREARLDPLTGVPVRRILDSGIQRAYRQSCEEGRSMAVIMCDVDHFKKVNDTYGHSAGDEALICVARALDSQRREQDLLARYGGEEFTVLLEDTTGESALQLADRLRRAVEAIDLVYEGQRIPLTLSAGVAGFPELHIKTASELLLLADEALYEAKETGRNRCLLNRGPRTFETVTGALSRLPEEPARPLPRIFG
ncbi:MAG: GGDEF domain-containing protein [Acidobacteriota bacterium]